MCYRFFVFSCVVASYDVHVILVKVYGCRVRSLKVTITHVKKKKCTKKLTHCKKLFLCERNALNPKYRSLRSRSTQPLFAVYVGTNDGVMSKTIWQKCFFFTGGIEAQYKNQVISLVSNMFSIISLSDLK